MKRTKLNNRQTKVDVNNEEFYTITTVSDPLDGFWPISNQYKIVSSYATDLFGGREQVEGIEISTNGENNLITITTGHLIMIYLYPREIDDNDINKAIRILKDEYYTYQKAWHSVK